MSIQKYFKEAIDRGASDLHLIEGSFPRIRVNGDLLVIGDAHVNIDYVKNEMFGILSEELIKRFRENLDLDFSYEFFGVRFRINLHKQNGRVALAARLILNNLYSPDELNFTDTMNNLTRLMDGLILVTGPTGAGKSTTLAAMIDTINRERGEHIITIEDPVEYQFCEDKSIIEQREIGRDTNSFSNALRHTLRQDPDVIMVGEMRDQDTISAALTAAETGHMVFSTLHTRTASESIERIVDSFPAHQQKQILIQLASSLRAIVSQKLIPKIGGGRVAAYEILINNSAIANLIRTNKTSQIQSSIQTGAKDGMITMNKSIEKLVKDNTIDSIIAKRYTRSDSTKAVYS